MPLTKLGGTRRCCLHTSRICVSIGLAASCLAVPAAGQPPRPLQSPPLRGPVGQTATLSTTSFRLPIAYAQRVERGPEIDGDVLGEAVWMAASSQTGFRQNTPDEGVFVYRVIHQ